MSRSQTPTVTAGQLNQWLAALDAHGVRFVVVNKQHDNTLLDLVRSRPDWSTDFEDGDVALLARILVPEAV